MSLALPAGAGAFAARMNTGDDDCCSHDVAPHSARGRRRREQRALGSDALPEGRTCRSALGAGMRAFWGWLHSGRLFFAAKRCKKRHRLPRPMFMRSGSRRWSHSCIACMVLAAKLNVVVVRQNPAAFPSRAASPRGAAFRFAFPYRIKSSFSLSFLVAGEIPSPPHHPAIPIPLLDTHHHPT